MRQAQLFDPGYRPRSKSELAAFEAKARRRIAKRLYYRTPKGREAKARYKRAALLRKLGAPADLYETLKRRQDNRCALCGMPSPGKELAIDHDHRTGRVRGLLCGPCNTALARVDADPEWGLRAYAYVHGRPTS